MRARIKAYRKGAGSEFVPPLQSVQRPIEVGLKSRDGAGKHGETGFEAGFQRRLKSHFS